MSWGGTPLPYLNEVGSERQSEFLQVSPLDSAGRCVLLRFVNSGRLWALVVKYIPPTLALCQAACPLQSVYKVPWSWAGTVLAPPLPAPSSPKAAPSLLQEEGSSCSVGLGCVFCLVSNSLL